ncbi:phosphoglycerate dehydrogenase [Streptomyces sp. NPDC017230]|uniref:phosphoglycerate dehydrogenase n=1 Tax=unclassified Streptomyces TaxID=2593676 RepID=UPI003795F797
MSTPGRGRTTLITTPTFARHSPDPWTLLADGGAGPVRPYEDRALPHDELLRRIAGADALVAGMDPVTAEVMDAAPRLKVIAKHGVGTDTIDLAAARDRGIPVVCAPGSNARAVAEFTFGLVLDATRRISASHTAVVEGGWPKLFGPELHGRTIGVVGFGRIGRLVASYASAFGMRVLAHDPYVPGDAVTEADAEPVTLDALLAHADVVTLHLPPTGEPLLNAARLAAMKPGAILVNAARGGLVDDAALAAALHSGHLAAAALDAFAVEPLPDGHVLRTAPRLTLTSHMAACTPEANRAMGLMVAEDILRVLAGESPHHAAR